MARAEWLRTFVSMYRAGSVTAAARQRGLSQPAASQQLAALERAAGGVLFRRTREGLEPTPLGRELYAEVTEPLDRLERVLAGLDTGSVRPPSTPVRVGSSAEYFTAVLVPRCADLDVRIRAVFAPDPELVAGLVNCDLDVIVTTSAPPRRATVSARVGDRRFVLVASPGRLPSPAVTAGTLAAWLHGQPWVSYSAELPVTRRFWQSFLGQPFAADLRLVAPDLRGVLAAVEAGMGVSLLPEFVCTDALAAGRVAEVFPVSDHVPSEPVFASVRPSDLARPEVAAVLEALGAPPGRSRPSG